MPDLLLVQGDFYPRPLRGGRPDTVNAAMQPFKFLSTPSARRATREPTPRTEAMQFLSTPSARRATKPETDIRIDKLISIHALCEEGDDTLLTAVAAQTEFLSTPSARRATANGMRRTRRHTNFYPRPLRGGRPIFILEETAMSKFLSTPSARRATPQNPAPTSSRCYFYPRPLRGGRHERNGDFEGAKEFLSTPSARRATKYISTSSTLYSISIHALCEEGDPDLGGGIQDFTISIHALCEEGDSRGQQARGVTKYFYPRPLRGGRRRQDVKLTLNADFYPRPLRGGRRP